MPQTQRFCSISTCRLPGLEISLSESTVTETKFFQRCFDTLKNAYMFWRKSKNVVALGTQFADSFLARLSEWPMHGTKCATEQSHLSNAWVPSYFPAILLSFLYDCPRHFLISIPACLRNELSDSYWMQLASLLQQQIMSVKNVILISTLKNSIPSPPWAPWSHGPWGLSLTGLSIMLCHWS